MSAHRTILQLAVPIMIGLLLMNVLNVIDIFMVSELGDATLAAAGIGSYLFLLSVAAFIGLSTAVQALAARRLGQPDLALPLRAAHGVIIAFGVPWTALNVLLAPLLVRALVTDGAVVQLATEFFVYRCIGILAFGLSLAHVGYLNGSRRPGRFVAVASFVVLANVALNALLIHGRLGVPAMGLAGAGLASSIALFMGLCLYSVLALARDRDFGMAARAASWSEHRALIQLAAPLCIERVVFMLGVAAYMGVLGRLSVRELAAANVLMNLLALARIVQTSFGMASVSLVGSALEADRRAAKRWGWQASKSAVVAMLGFGAVLGLFGEPILSLFILDEETRANARVPLLIVCFTIWIDAIGIVLEQALAAVGKGRQVLLYGTSLHWLVLLPGAYLVGPHLGYGLTGVWCVQAGYRLLHTSVLATLWSRFDVEQQQDVLGAELRATV